MSDIPAHLKYAETHEWVRPEADGTVTVGITDHAQYQLGDLVYIELPEVGREVEAGKEMAVVESVKAASDVYAPVSGTVLAVNPALDANPEKVNQSPYADAWMLKLQVANPAEADKLLSAADYTGLTG